MNRYCAFISFLLIFHGAVGQMHFGVMTYNCENAFDTIHDSGFDDYEFLPDGEKQWKRWKFFDKIMKIARVILSVDSVQPVDVVCLCEVENDTVVDYLTKRTFLSRLGYEYLITKSDDSRGLDVALLYSPFTFKVFESQSIRNSLGAKTRDVLRASGELMTGDTLDVFALHLPSKLGGEKSEELREMIVKDVRKCIDSLFMSRLNPNIIVMGDFNSDANSPLITKTLSVNRCIENGGKYTDLCQLLYHSSNDSGTYKYRGVWSAIDNIFVSRSVLSDYNSIYTKPEWCRVIDLPFLLENDKSDRSKRPRRSFLGDYYRNGFSDHLPVYLKFEYLFNKEN